jgi:hypothetical protein
MLLNTHVLCFWDMAVTCEDSDSRTYGIMYSTALTNPDACE